MKKITAKEDEVMEMIWQIGNCTPRDVYALYPDPKPHINTIATMSSRSKGKAISPTR